MNSVTGKICRCYSPLQAADLTKGPCFPLKKKKEKEKSVLNQSYGKHLQNRRFLLSQFVVKQESD